MAEYIVTVNDYVQPDGKQTIMEWKPLVRCKDCIKEECCCIRRTDNPDWFCADGQFAIIENQKQG